MHKFTDSKGDEWLVQITIGHIKPIEAETGVNLLKLDKPFPLDSDDWQQADGSPLLLLTRLDMDLELLFSVIYAACKPHALELGIGEVEFCQRMEGQAHLDAHTAFWAELQDFFQSARRMDLVRAIQKQRAMMDAAIRKVVEKMDRIDIDEKLSQIFGDASGATPASAALTQDRSRSANSPGPSNQRSNTTGCIPAKF